MSNAQKYNDVLGFVSDDSVKHTNKFNDTKRRLSGNGFEFSDEEFAKLYKLVNGTSGEVFSQAPREISDDEANKLDDIEDYICGHDNEWFTFTDVCLKSGAIKYTAGECVSSTVTNAMRNRLKKLFDKLVDKKIFNVERMELKTDNMPVLHVYRAY